ncbi:hypothetical protein [Fructobacillus ficulneus]|uniref:Uncharacterized protein n=1 Tax=Fructobacillus ficulneus TaxID=157463 RepID=A0A0K8MJ58_9LACO|nr:hypothetical protein [Fructobacillus ficulneus]GAO99919.1 hypothetical protein FFIC_260330 [Fructobacillus ficulneus]
MVKKVILIITSILAVGLLLDAAYSLGKNHHSHPNKEANQNTLSSQFSHTNDNSQTSSSNSDASATTFNALPQKIQLALLAYQELPSDYGTGRKSTYNVYMGDKDKIVINNTSASPGAGDAVAHSVLFTDNHNGTFTVSGIQSTGESAAAETAANSYWSAYKTKTAQQMLDDYQQHKVEINFVSGEMDLSKSNQAYPYLPTSQTSMPN